jgi:hypothetical protein
MKFKYSPVTTPNGNFLCHVDGRQVKRPMLELKLMIGDGYTTYGLIDSGADTTTVNISYAEALGLELGEEKSIRGIGEDHVVVRPGVFPFEIKDMGIKIEVPAWFSSSRNVDILLGQEVFFERFRIKFERDHNTFEVIDTQ